MATLAALFARPRRSNSTARRAGPPWSSARNRSACRVEGEMLMQPAAQRSGAACAGRRLLTASGRRDGDGDFFRGERQRVRHVLMIAEDQLQRVLAGRQVERRFSLAAAEVAVFVVLRDGLIARQQFVDV